MKIYEKAVENYAKARKKFYRQMLRHDVEHFNHLIDKMVADCECRGIECKYCPVHLVAVPARADKLDIDMNHDEQVYDKQLVCALKKCSDENRDKPTFTGNVVISSVCKSAADRISQLLAVVQRQDKVIKKMRSCDNCKYRSIHTIAEILESEPEKPCLGCKKYNRWEVI